MTGLLSPTIAIVDIDSGISLAERTAAAAALTKQVLQHFAPAWGVTAVVVADAPKPDDWQLQLRKVPTIDGALGYHDRQPDGTPILYVFPELCAQDGDAWTSCASHEILEALADPLLRRCVQLPDGRIAAMEVCDQVEAINYLIDGVMVSNFNLPANFEPEAGKTEQYDYLGRQTAPFQVLGGGYAQVFAAGTGWSQIGAMRAYRAKVAELGLSRGVRRGP